MTDLYEDDFYTWAMTQADAAKRRSANEIDWENIAEELEGLGKSQASELKSHYFTLLLHLLKWAHQPRRRSRSWRLTVMRARGDIADVVADNPGLKSRNEELFVKAYRAARNDAARETKLPLNTFPASPPFTPEEVMDETFWPGPPSDIEA